MPDFDTVIDHLFTAATLIHGVLSDPRPKAEETARRVRVRPVVLRGETVFQFEYQHERNVTHKNLAAKEAEALVRTLLTGTFRQAQFYAADADYQFRARPNGSVAVSATAPTKADAAVATEHDRPKEHLLAESEAHPFLVRLGIQGPGGAVLAARRDKFKQINRFLQMVAVIEEHLPASGPLKIVDFGCGKGYLTFALYHYLHVLRGRDVQLCGIDVRPDVIDTCSRIARDLEFDGLEFRAGTIQGYSSLDSLDMVVALHACDTATDDALAKAVAAEASVILAAPCCQHELRDQIGGGNQAPLLRHGILKDRLSALVTDAARAALLETAGYTVQAVEFIDPEHTPKNLLLRAVRRRSTDAREERLRAERLREYEAFRDFWGIRPALEIAISRPTED